MSFLRQWWKAFPTLITLSLGMLAAEKLGWLEPIKNASLDFFLRAEKRVTPENIYIVAITDEDYKKHFNETSPLDPCTLMKLVERVVAAKPAVVAVDLDTSSQDYKSKPCPEPPHSDETKLIWALAPDELEKSGSGTLHFSDPRVLGRPISDEAEIGIPTFPVAGDGVVRKYAADFETDLPSGESLHHTKIESLPRAIAKAWPDPKKPNFEGRDEGIIHFTGRASPYPVIQSDEFLHNAADPDAGKAEFDKLKGKIVLVGGMYRAARDRYPTPVGTMSGVELIAHAVQSDLMGGAIREVGAAAGILLDLLAGSIIVAVYYRWEHHHFRRAFWTSMLLIPALSLLFSAVFFNTKAYWFDFAPVLLGVILHQLFETSKKHQETRRELDEALERIHQLEQGKAEAAKPL